MSELLLTLIVPHDIAEAVEDCLLARPDLIAGFTAHAADGHGRSVQLVTAGERVAGHVPRTLIQTVGEEDALRTLLTTIHQRLPQTRLVYWLTPVIEMGRL